jgi:hypothetical protein
MCVGAAGCWLGEPSFYAVTRSVPKKKLRFTEKWMPKTFKYHKGQFQGATSSKDSTKGTILKDSM